MAHIEETPALKSFRARVRATLQHLELVEAALALVEEKSKKADDARQPLAKALGVPGKFETLQAPAQQVRQVTNFSRGENLELALLALYVHFLSYLRALLPEVHRHRPLDALTGGADAEAKVSWERVVQRYEGRGGVEELVGKLLAATGVELDPEVGREAHAYLAMRDLYVYNAGIVDAEFARYHGAAWNAQPGFKLPKNLKIGRSAARAVERLAVEIDTALRPLLVGAEI